MLSDDMANRSGVAPHLFKKGAFYGKCVWNDPRLGNGRMEQ